MSVRGLFLTALLLLHLVAVHSEVLVVSGSLVNRKALCGPTAIPSVFQLISALAVSIGCSSPSVN